MKKATFGFMICFVFIFCKAFSLLNVEWNLPPINLTGLVSGNASAPKITTDASGSIVHAVWHRLEGVNLIVETASSYDGGSTWSDIVPLTLIGSDAVIPDITTDSSGTIVHAIWTRGTATQSVVESLSSYDAGVTWPAAGSATQLSNTVANHIVNDTGIVTDNSGKMVHAIWIRSDTTIDDFYIESSTSLNGGANWPAPATVTVLDTSSNPKGLDDPKIVTSDGGSVVHASYQKNNSDIFVRSSVNTAASWTSPIQISLANSDKPIIATNNTGSNVFVVWVTSGIIYTSRSLDFGATWPLPGNSLPLTVSGVGDFPQIVTDQNGTNVYTIWIRDISPKIVETRSSNDSGSSFLPVSALTLQNPAENASSPQIVTNNIGNVVVAIWPRYTNPGYNIETMSSVDFGATWPTAGSASILQTSSGSLTISSAMIASNFIGSRFHAIWTRDYSTFVGDKEVEYSSGMLSIWFLLNSMDIIR